MVYTKFLALAGVAAMLAACGGDSDSNAKGTEPVEDLPTAMFEGPLTDARDGQTYKTVTIGLQTWMAQNLNYEMANSYCYNNESANCPTYGRFYTWAAAMMACPTGWHLPSETEWRTLFTVVGGSTVAGIVLKSQSGWSKNGNGMDAYGFSALPAGYRDYRGEYINEGYGAHFWSSAGSLSGGAFYMVMYSDIDNAYLYDISKNTGNSVRCVKDE